MLTRFSFYMVYNICRKNTIGDLLRKLKERNECINGIMIEQNKQKLDLEMTLAKYYDLENCKKIDTTK